ncbi:MAG: hypothetical protein BWY73_00064 [candidate division TA06 bacterium ADurb.Bin417]|uniref:Uncharacterized protein n=1 Tax=candidate division TA06 bacterium ADurb.Bin417 TaxID=1852828 RepID=A0A1V5MKZ9_UNCT6|nr:MAG: hypothetical protein BWY73_00064 [candidate division TA06 bacterium ADurb.Bin417]
MLDRGNALVSRVATNVPKGGVGASARRNYGEAPVGHPATKRSLIGRLS